MLGYGAAQKFLRATTIDERSDIQALAMAARELQREHDLERANQIANQVGKLFG
jgi:uncharacterized protein HemY